MRIGGAGASVPWRRLVAEFAVIVAGVPLGRLEEPIRRIIELLRAELNQAPAESDAGASTRAFGLT